MRLANLIENIIGKHRYATTDDVRDTFGDYHNALNWLATFLVGDEKGSDIYVVDAGMLAESQTPDFHDWLVHWAARATLRRALQSEQNQIAELAAEYENKEANCTERDPLSPKEFQCLVRNSEEIRDRLDVLCRFVLVIRGIAKESIEEVAAQLGISRNAVQCAYCVALDTLFPSDKRSSCSAPALKALGAES